jgi:hypothetical protein
MFVALDWIEAHCVVPDGFRKGDAFRMYRWQLEYKAAFYLVRGEARWVPENPILAPAFVYRRGLLVGPQKLGKSPDTAAHICLEGVGPALFAGWAGVDEGYVCAEHGCGCGWEYPYELGEPKGMPWPSPLIQVTAVSEDQTDNIYHALRPMIDDGPLHPLIPKTGEQFIRLPQGGESKIEIVTASEQSRLGARATFIAQTEVGLWTARNKMTKVADTQYRNLAGMGGRASLESNSWDPAQQSVAQREFESGATDVYRQFTQPPKHLSYANKRDRRKIHLIVYPEDTRRENGGHVDLEAIESEAADMAARDLSQASRFFGNGLATGSGRAFDVERFRALAMRKPKAVDEGALIVIGIDGSRLWDATSIIATEITTGYQWPLGIWERPPDAERWEVPEGEVEMAVDAAFERWTVWRMYCDPPYWESNIATWAGRYGDERVVKWWTNRPKSYGYALRTWAEAIRTGELRHCHRSAELCALFTAHVGNAYRVDTGYQDDGQPVWIVSKDRDRSPDKIDSVPAAALSWEARTDAIAAGVTGGLVMTAA